MGLVFRPGSRRQVPSGPVRIDWNHPLAFGLTSCFVPGTSLRDLVGNATPLVPDTGAAADTSFEGPAAKSLGNSSGLYTLAPAAVKSTAALSCYWRGSFQDIVGATDALIAGLSYADPEASPYVVIGVQRASNADIRFWGDGVGGFGGSAYNLINGGTNGAMHSAAVTMVSSGAVTGYYDGAQAATYSMGGALSYSATTYIGVGGYESQKVRDPSCLTALFYTYNRALSAEEMAALHQDPYAFLVPAEGDMPAISGPAGPKPFLQSEWPVPRGYVPAISLRTHLDPTKLLLIGKDQFFGAPGMGPDYDYPNPRIAGRLNAGFTTAILPQLFMQDVFFGPPGMGPDYDNPNPVLARRAQQPQATPNFLALTSVAAAAPFSGLTFDNPRPAPRAHAGQVQATPLPILAAASTPFGQTSWPTPSTRPAPRLDAAPQSLALTAAPAAVPVGFAAFDMPVRRPVAPLTFAQAGLALYSFVPVPAPFYQTDWPNPVRRPVSLSPAWGAPLTPSLIPPTPPPVDPWRRDPGASGAIWTLDAGGGGGAWTRDPGGGPTTWGKS